MATLGNLLRFSVINSLAKRFCHHNANLILKEHHLDNKVCRLVLNNPKKRNAMSLDMLNALKNNIIECSKDDQLRVIIIAAQPPVFSAGHDLKELTSATGTEKHAEVFQRCTEVMSLVQDIQLPVIAEVKGIAAAAGCQLVASCDIVISADNAQFSTPGAKAGLFCSTPGVAVARAVQPKMALYMLLTGDNIDAKEALRSGLVTKIVSENKVEEEALSVARKICDLSRPVIALGKSFFYTQISQSRQVAYRHGEKVMVENLRLVDAQEGIDSFIKKKKPNWTHKVDKVF